MLYKTLLQTNLTRFIRGYKYAINYEMEVCGKYFPTCCKKFRSSFSVKLKKAEVFLLGPMPHSSR